MQVSERKLKAWVDAGLIDATTASRIREHEAQTSRPLGLWALVGLGALAIGLGLVSVVAANWDAIPGMARLGIHLVLLAASGGFLWWQQARGGDINAHFHDALLFIFGALGLTFFGHLGQVYQTSSSLWQPFGIWLLLFTPLLLGFGRGWLAALMWMAALCFTAQQHWDWYLGNIGGAGIFYDREARLPFSLSLYQGLISSIPAIVVGGAAAMRGRSARPEFWKKLEQIALVLVVIWFSFAGLYRLIGAGAGMIVSVVLIQSLLLLIAASAVWFSRPGNSGQATAAILAACAITNLGSAAALEGSLAGAILFAIVWGTVAGGALHAGWRGVFQIAVGVLALRLIILSFELASDLLGSGVGLILAGVATLAIAFAAVRVSKRYAPKGDAT